MINSLLQIPTQPSLSTLHRTTLSSLQVSVRFMVFARTLSIQCGIGWRFFVIHSLAAEVTWAWAVAYGAPPRKGHKDTKKWTN